MNSCPHAKNIIAYRLGLLNKGERQQFEAHLEQCSACQREIKLESVIEQELSRKFEPGQIEQYVLAAVRLHKAAEPRLSWLYLIRMGVFAGAMITMGLVIVPWILDFPFDRFFNIKIDFNLPAQLYGFLEVFSSPFVILAIGLILIAASSIYSYIALRE